MPGVFTCLPRFGVGGTHRNRSLILALLLASAFLCTLHCTATAQTFSVTDLGTVPGRRFPNSAAEAVDNGQVVGYAYNATHSHAFSWTAAGGMLDLGALVGGAHSSATAVDSGQVVGHAYYAFSWVQAGGMVDLGTLPDGGKSGASALSNGQVVGWANTGDRDTNGNLVFHAFSWTPVGGMVDLGTLGKGKINSRATAISNGQVVGWADTGDKDTNHDSVSHAFSWTAAGGMVDLGTLGNGKINSRANAVSNGQVVGWAGTGRKDANGNPVFHAFSWTAAGGMVDLGTLGSSKTNSQATAVSNGQVVGWADTGARGANGSPVSHAFSWTAAGGMVDLGTLGSSKTNSRATAVSGKQIVGYADVGNGLTHAVLWARLCAGDCTGNGTVTVADALTLVNLALGAGRQNLTCPTGVPTGTQVNVALIIQAVNNALTGCGP